MMVGKQRENRKREDERGMGKGEMEIVLTKFCIFVMLA